MVLDEVPEVHTCCCGLISLKAGTYIIAIVTLIVDLGGHGYFLTTYPFGTLIYQVFVIMMVFAIMASLSLIIGVYYNKRPWVFFFIIIYFLLFVGTIVMILWTTLSATNARYSNYTNDVIDAAIYCLFIGYCLIVVSSYYKTMPSNETRTVTIELPGRLKSRF